MSLSRRGFLRHTVVVGPITLVLFTKAEDLWAQGGVECTLPDAPPPVRFVPNETRVLKRVSTVEIGQDSAALAKFRNAIGLVRALPDEDVLGWKKLVAQHCIHCASTNTSNIHYDWQFLPWHRALLYFLERTLRKLSQDDAIRLVYWPWEDPGSRVLPPIYAPQDQPLYWGNRGNLSAPEWPLPDSKVDVQGLLAVPDFADFGGTPVQRQPTPLSYGGPHANVHNNFLPAGDMRNLQYSPRDPVFYAHHGNIDRLWASWSALPGHVDADFGDAKVYFYDENKVWSYVLMNDLRDTKKLGYEYSTLMQPDSGQPTFKSYVMGSLAKGRMALKAEVMAEVEQPGSDFLAIESIHNVEHAPSDVTDFGIFARKPPVGTDSKLFKGFLGIASRVLSEGHAHNGPISVVLRVTGKLGELIKKEDRSVELTIAPLDAAGKTTAEAAPLEADKILVIT